MGGGEGEADIDAITTITCYELAIHCLLISLDAHMLSHNGYGTARAQGPKRVQFPPLWGRPFGPGARARAHIHYR